jgi:hypothetical protein
MSIVTIELVSIECADCGMVFGVTPTFRQWRVGDHKVFYCPNGHGNIYYAKTEAEKLKQELELAKNRARGEERRREAAERSLAATKGVVTKMRKRIGNGTCPCCNRHFTDLHRHMETKHPEFKEKA